MLGETTKCTVNSTRDSTLWPLMDFRDERNTISESGNENVYLTKTAANMSTRQNHHKLEIRSVERNICPIAKSTMNELFL